MITQKAWLFLVLLGLVGLVASESNGSSRLKVAHPGQNQPALARRQYPMDQQQQIADQSLKDPVGAIDTVKNMPNFYQTNPTFAQASNGLLVQSSDGDEAQVPWFDDGNFEFSPNPNVPQGPNGGWSWLPGDFPGFTMKKDLVVSDQTINGTAAMPVQPYYVSTNVDPHTVRRVVICFPGKQRDSWKYATMFNNALNWVYNQKSYGIKQGDVMIIAPTILNMDDLWAGGVEGNWLAYDKSVWQMGGVSHFPPLEKSVTFYSAIDKIIKMVMNQTNYPQVNQVVIAGHSMGGQATQRYALLKADKKYDANIKYWVGNPGSWAWLQNGSRPVPTPGTQCNPASEMDKWPYGVGNLSSIPKYARKNMTQDSQYYIQRYLKRYVHYGLALLDNGAGDTHCQAQYQGASHLERGTNFVDYLSKVNNGQWPTNHNLSYVAGVSHQDYPMIAATQSLDFIFGPDINVPRTDTYGLPKNHTHSPHRPAKGPPMSSSRLNLFRIVAWVILAAIIVALIIGFFVFDRVFTPNTNDWDRDYWESDFKRRLL